MEYDYYKLYLGDDYNGYKEEDKKYCDTLEQVWFELNKASMFDKYIVVGHNKDLNQDDILAQGRIEINKAKTWNKKGR